ncbi:alpha-2-macroglobulin family protein [Parvularcula sp. ZS-1/3]|uniref:Alpha-2-macroglobulin family protein n=1 Tax=Parvularcula mediterranea TaxID=2732508 RepID=A0A7Y3W5F5_9PROT|nr:alpha-2-macroglobulin [Parvularcula mediterranea]NNU16569.1 alpha-2-macroglobulin family protein [Parvularcula mediterranea]
MKFLRSAALAVSSLLLVSCDFFGGSDESQEPSATRTAEAPSQRSNAQEQAQDTPFVFQRTSVREDRIQPTLCLHFTKPLDPSADYEPFVEIERSVAIAVDGQALCIEGLDYGQEAELTLLAGLPSADGERLERDETVTLTFTDRPPVVQFAGNGIILPREDARGLAIQTVNVTEVSVRITRVNDRALVQRRITEGFSGAEGRYEYTPYDEEPGELSSFVYEGTLETPGARNVLTTTLMPVEESFGELEAGAYYVQVSDASAADRGESQPARAGRWIIVTDLALTAYRSASGLDVTVRSLSSAEPVGRTMVRLISQANEVLSSKVASRVGRVRFDPPLLRGEVGDRPKLVVVEGRGGNFAFIDLDRAPLDLSAHPVSGRQQAEDVEAYLYTERGIYRPGETVHVNALARNAEGYAADDRPGALVLRRPNGLEQARVRLDALEKAGSAYAAFELPKAASRGVWSAALELDGLGQVGSVSFSVEDFVPQRLALTLEADTETPLALGGTRMVEARLRFLYGAPGAGLRVDGSARVERQPNPFPQHEGYSFGLHDAPYRAESFELPVVTTDGEGVAALPIAPEDLGEGAAEPLRVRAVVRAEEPGGRAVQDDVRIPYRTRKVYLGLKPGFEGSAEREKPATFELRAVDGDGVPLSTDVRWRLIRRDYEYDWYREESGRWRWRRSKRIVTITEGLAQPGADAALVSTPELPWGDYTLIASHDGEDLASRGFWVGYGGRSADGTPAPDSVRILTPDEGVTVGQEITVAIQPPYAGIAEVAVAADGILSLEHVDVPAEGTEVTLTVTEEWGAGAYVLVSLYTDRKPGIQPIPRRAVGAAYVPMNMDGRTFDVALDMPELVRPREDLTVTIDGGDIAAGQEVYATLAAVDEGILLLTRYASPDPEDYIFGKRSLGVDVYDDYGRLLDPDTGEMGRLRSGGDAIGGAGLSVVPTKTVALFEGPVSFGSDGEAQIDVAVPDFNGELRVMAVLWSDDALGSASAPLTVRDPVPAELVLPRFLSPGDSAEATLTVDNVEGAAGTYNYTVSTESGSIEPVSGSFDLSAGERREASVPLTAGDPGVETYTLAVEGPRGFSISRTYQMETRGAFLPERRYARATVEAGGGYTPPADLFDGLIPGSVSTLISASPTPIDRASLSNSLLSYPYGCTEQLVSRATPLLYKSDRDDRETRILRETVETLLERQGPDGAFGLWRVGDRSASPWLGAYAVEFLAAAREAGMPVPEAALDLAHRALQPVSMGELYRAYGYDTRIRSPRYTEDTQARLEQRSSAYSLYVLAKAGKADRSRLRYVHDAQLDEIESPLAKAQIGAALAAIGDRGRSENALKRAVATAGYVNRGDWYQTINRDAAGIIQLLAESGRTEQAAALYFRADENFPDPLSMTTQEKAFLLKAAEAMARGRDQAFLTKDGSQTQSDVLDGIPTGERYDNAGDETIYVSTLTEGIPSEAPTATSQGIEVTKAITDTAGNEVDLTTLARGDRVIVKLTLNRAEQRRAQLVVTDLLPAGLEIEAVLDPGDAVSGPYRFLGRLTRADIAEARDDRFVASVIRAGNDPFSFAYIARAVTPGSFTLPGAVTEDMYRPQIFGRSASREMVIAP